MKCAWLIHGCTENIFALSDWLKVNLLVTDEHCESTSWIGRFVAIRSRHTAGTAFVLAREGTAYHCDKYLSAVYRQWDSRCVSCFRGRSVHVPVFCLCVCVYVRVWVCMCLHVCVLSQTQVHFLQACWHSTKLTWQLPSCMSGLHKLRRISKKTKHLQKVLGPGISSRLIKKFYCHIPDGYCKMCCFTGSAIVVWRPWIKLGLSRHQQIFHLVFSVTGPTL